jgi:hypothetical protein
VTKDDAAEPLSTPAGDIRVAGVTGVASSWPLHHRATDRDADS